jgi:hypothetical protein
LASNFSRAADDPESFAELDGHCCVVEGAEVGFEIGSIFGPIGEAIGTVVGAGVGALAGVAAADAISNSNGAGGSMTNAPFGPIHAYEKAKADAQKPQQAQPTQPSQSTPASPNDPNYQPNPKHDQPRGDDRKGVSPQPAAGGSLMDQAVQVKPGSSVAVDQSKGKFVVYKTDANGQTHGYETTWKGLRNDQRAALQKAGLVTKRGKIVPQQATE